jgi:PadR family transcriptional regulator, regulatory protein AphA
VSRSYTPVESMSNQPASATAYALLALLRLRDRWTTYELTKELRRNARFFWPRAESRLYQQAKRLVELGLAATQTETQGGRPRTIYTITPAGRRALTDWLAAPPTRGVLLEAEALLRFLAGGDATPEELMTAIERAEDEARDLLAVADVIAREYLEGAHPFQDEVHVRAFIFDLLTTHARAVLEWTQRSRAELAAWPRLGLDERRARALERIRQLS